jgi:hypothetical protein
VLPGIGGASPGTALGLGFSGNGIEEGREAAVGSGFDGAMLKDAEVEECDEPEFLG